MIRRPPRSTLFPSRRSSDLINIPVCGMVKDDNHRTRGLIYNNEELFIKSNSQLMHLITRIQDEVHRFAITYHRSLREDRKSTRLNSSHANISYAVFCLKKKI